MMEYTEGDWKARETSLGDWSIYTEGTDGRHIANVDRHFDAHLIAKAPKMAVLLRDILDAEKKGNYVELTGELKQRAQALAQADRKE